MYQREHFFRLVKNGLEVVFSLISENQNAETLQFDLSKCEKLELSYSSPCFTGRRVLTTQKYSGNYYEVVGENKIKIVLSNLHNAPYLLNGVAYYGSYTLSICSLQIDVPSNVSQGIQDLGTITQVVVKSFEIGGGGGGGGFTPTEAQQQAMDSGITSEILGDIETDIDNLKENLANFVGNFNSYADLLDYEGTLTNNDYAVVGEDETHSNECWRYVYNATTGLWVAQYKINETPISTIDQSSNPTDTDSLSDLNGTTNKRWTFLRIWNYIKGKFTYDTNYTDAPEDTDTLANLDKDTAKIKRITFANLWTWVLTKITGICEKGIQISGGKLGHTNAITAQTNSRIYAGKLDAQGHYSATPTALQYSDVYNSSLDNCLFTRKGAYNMYNYFLPTSTNLTFTLSGSSEISVNQNDSKKFTIGNLNILYINITIKTNTSWSASSNYITLSTTFTGTVKTELAKVKSSDSAHIAFAAINQGGSYPTDAVDFYNITSSSANIRISARNGLGANSYIKVQGTFVYLS